MSVGFRNITKCQIKAKISASDTTVLLENTADYVPFISSPGEHVYAVLRDQQYKEIVKIDVSASSIYGLSVARGQENTSAKSWNRGTLFYQDLTAESLDILRQKEVFRTVTYNPNGITAPAYAYEKIYQTGATACEKRWWKSVNATNLVWLLIAGTICPNEIWYPPEDWDWDVPPDWEWPVIVYQVATPLMIPDGGTYGSVQSIDISCATSGSTIYYTTDGTEPDDNSTEYTVPVSITGVTTLKAIAYRANTVTSEIATEDYRIVMALWDIVACGERTAIGQLSNGELWGWGNNAYGQLAQGETTAIKFTPIQVSGLTTWAYLAGGRYSVYAIKNDGTLWVCGFNSNGQLGLGDTTDRHTLTQVGTGTTWAKVFSYYYDVFAIKTDGTLWAWGYNNYGQLGLGDDTVKTSPVQVGTLTNYTFVTTLSKTTIVLKTDGTLWICGYGEGNTLSQIGTATNWSKISTDPNHRLAIKTDGTLWAWGDNYYGQCGQGTSGSAHANDHLTPTQIGSLTTWKAVSVVHDSGCSAAKNDGTLWAWGRGSGGRLGLGDSNNYSTPQQVGSATDTDYPITGGSICSHVLKTGKALYSTGWYSAGPLGLGVIAVGDLVGGTHIETFQQITTLEI